MGDPLSIAANVVGVTVPALKATRLLLNIIEQLKDAPKTVARLSEDIRSLDTTLNLLNGVEEREWALLGINVAEQSKIEISSYKKACDLFRADLLRWTRHSEDGKLAWQDRAKVGFLKKAQIKAMSDQLQNCKLSINNVISIATLYSSVRNCHLTEDIRKSISIKQAEVNDAIATTDKQLVRLEIKLDEFDLSSDDEADNAPTDDTAELKQRLKDAHDALGTSRKLLEELLAKSQEESVARASLSGQGSSATITFGQNYSGFQAGIINGAVTGQTFGGK